MCTSHLEIVPHEYRLRTVRGVNALVIVIPTTVIAEQSGDIGPPTDGDCSSMPYGPYRLERTVMASKWIFLKDSLPVDAASVERTGRDLGPCISRSTRGDSANLAAIPAMLIRTRPGPEAAASPLVVAAVLNAVTCVCTAA